MLRKSFFPVPALAGLMLVFTAGDQAQTGRALITEAIDENRLVTLAGNTRPEANRQNDLGPVRSDLHLDMYLQLKRSPEQELAAAQFVESLTDKSSPNFHKWITAAEYGQRFGVASEDIATVSRWLASHGFTVNDVPANNMVIDFSGNAGQVGEALHTEIHTLDVAGERYFANMSDPRIPAALLPAVTGVVSLNNFKPRPMLVPKSQYTVNAMQIPVVPGDLATIYNLNPAFSAGYTGRGQTIVVVEDTDLFNGTGDWSVFRSTFGLTLQYPSGSLTQVHPSPGAGGGCKDPGINGDDSEAALDVEWASAAAPNAAIVMASCDNTTNFGGFIALQNLLTNGGALPSVVSISYGASETEDGAAFNNYINTLYQTAAAEGVSVFVSSGDQAAAVSDRGGTEAIHGINVSGWASTIYNVAVGGTDFGDTAANTTKTFWNSTNGVYYNSARSYVPEIPWNDSCGSQVLAGFLGFATTYGPPGVCNAYGFVDTTGGSGGPSACATGKPAVTGAVSGTCAGYSKPSWQSISGNPSDGVRDLPDVALFAADGFWNHYYVACYSDEGFSCTGAPSNWAGFGGTSISSPIMAGIQALINQAVGSKNVGNPNPVYYQIAANEYSTPAGRAACNSTAGPASTCSFIDITQGDINVPCAGAFNCYLDGEALGVLSLSNTSYVPAYLAAPGWDFATGIGSVNAFYLLNAFVNGTSLHPVVPTVDIDLPAPGSKVSGTVTVAGWAIDNASIIGTAISGVQVLVDGAAVGTATYGISRPDVCAAFPGRPGCPNVGYTFSLNTATLATGTHTITVTATDSAIPPDTGSASVTVTVGVIPTVFIDLPAPGSTVSGTVTVAGWAIDNASTIGTAISGVQVLVDGAAVGTATYGVSRPDVCAAFPGRPGCPNVGYTFSLNTAALATGTHTIRVTATDSAIPPDTGSASVTITVGVIPTVFIDSPAPGSTVSGTVTVAGWAIDNASTIGTAISGVQVLVDGAAVGTATYGVSRPDVCAAFPGRPGCPNVGYTFSLNTATLATGTHTIRVTATDSASPPDTGSAAITVQK